MSSRAPFRNNARLVGLAALGVLGLLLGVESLLRKSRDFAPDFLASVLLYALTVINLTLLLVLVLILGRNIVKALMERRRGVLGARFRMRLLSVFLLMSIAPSGLLALVGSDLIRQTVDRWFNVDVDRMLSSSQALGVALRQSLTERARVGGRAIAREVRAARLLEPEGQARLRNALELRARNFQLDLVSVHTRQGELMATMDPRLPPAPISAAAADTLVDAVLNDPDAREVEATTPFGDGELVRVAVPVGAAPTRGVVVASVFLSRELLAERREVQERYQKFRQAEALREPIKAVYISIYALAGLLVLFGAVWLALYLARRITVPLRQVADGAERIAAGERGVRVDFQAGGDEFAALITSFNRMSERLQRSEEQNEESQANLARQHRELVDRQRLIETVIETVGTGLLVLDGDGGLRAANPAALELLGLGKDVLGRPCREILGAELKELFELVERVLQGRGARHERELRVPAPGRVRQLALTVVALGPVGGATGGALVVVDDLTPLMRAQKVAAWGEVARKLAHEIKNPLTPIQLSAQRIRRAEQRGAPDLSRVVEEGTRAIEQEVLALKNLVDEFAQFARLPGANLVPANLHEAIEQSLSLYEGLFPGVRLERRFDPALPPLRLDPDQIKRVLLNLIDNAIEAVERRGLVRIGTEHLRDVGRVRLWVEDDGPGVPSEHREHLFEPHFSTKKRGSGLGLAIVHRIVEEHQGTIRVEPNDPRGTRFVIELPVS